MFRRTSETATAKVIRTMNLTILGAPPAIGAGRGSEGFLLVVAVLALLIATGFWMLDPQFKTGRTAAAKEPSATMTGAEVSAEHTPVIQDLSEKTEAPKAPADANVTKSAPASAAAELQLANQRSKPDPTSSTLARLREKASEKTPIKVAKAEPVPPPLPVASAFSPAGFTFKDCDFCPPLVVVPKGEFTMGSNEHPHEKPAHKVAIQHPFAIAQYEVTMEEWDRCVDAGACRYRPEHQGSPKAPVGNLSWEDANSYLKWLSEKTGQIYRLPSEAEWEYSARAGTSKRFWWGDEASSGKASCSDCGSGTNGQPSAVGTYKPNPFGLYDTAGNIAEWVQDCWNASYRGAPADGSAWLKGNCSLRGLRGGSFGNKAAFARSASRFRYDSDVRYEANGFRVLRELP